MRKVFKPFRNGDSVDFTHGGEEHSGIIVQTYAVPYVTIVDFQGERFYVSCGEVEHAVG